MKIVENQWQEYVKTLDLTAEEANSPATAFMKVAYFLGWHNGMEKVSYLITSPLLMMLPQKHIAKMSDMVQEIKTFFEVQSKDKSEKVVTHGLVQDGWDDFLKMISKDTEVDVLPLDTMKIGYFVGWYFGMKKVDDIATGNKWSIVVRTQMLQTMSREIEDFMEEAWADDVEPDLVTNENV